MKDKPIPIINNVPESAIYIFLPSPFLVSRGSYLRATCDETPLGKFWLQNTQHNVSDDRLATQSLSHKSNPLAE